MVDLAFLGLSAVLGALVGGAFFGSLWWGLRLSLGSARPLLWLVGTQVVRTVAAAAALVLIAGGRLDRLGAALVGLLLARYLVKRFVVPGATHAP
jgi:F1F0 ATPase subunit 2